MFSPDQFVAHRGYARHYPENTLTAITAAIRAGASHIEVDIQFSQDGVPFLYHDASLLRVSGINASILDYPADALCSLSAYEPQRFGDYFRSVPIATVEEFALLVSVRSFVHFYVELKEESITRHGAHYCLEQLAQLFKPCLDSITLISFDLEAVRLAKKQYGFLHTGIIFRDWAQRDNLIDAYYADIAYINIQRIPQDAAIQANCPIVVYEIDQPDLAANALQRGAAKVETYAIGELIQALCKPNMI